MVESEEEMMIEDENSLYNTFCNLANKRNSLFLNPTSPDIKLKLEIALNKYLMSSKFLFQAVATCNTDNIHSLKFPWKKFIAFLHDFRLYLARGIRIS